MIAGAAPKLGDRALFPDLRAHSYLAHSAISPASTPVFEAMAACTADNAALGVASHGKWLQDRDALRGELAVLVGSDKANIALLGNTTAGVVNIALCFPWQRGDTVVLLRGEFPTNVTPWLQAAQRHGLQVRWADADRFRTDPDGALDELDKHVSGARLLAISAVQFQTGLAMPLEAIGALCRERGCALFVDAIQAVGAMPVDVRAIGADFLACGGHKWLMGPEGTGFLHIAARWHGALRLETAGWLSHDDPLDFLFAPGLLRYDKPLRSEPSALETGMINTAGFAGLRASVRLLQQLGAEAIFGHIQTLHGRIEAELMELGFVTGRSAQSWGRSGILSMKPPGDRPLAEWTAALADRGVVVTGPDGWLRFAPHWPNALDEVPRIMAAARELT